MKVGGYQIDVIETGRFGLDGGAMFGVVPKVLWERAYTRADGRNRIPMAAKAMLIRSADRVILVDTGNSPDMPDKLKDIYGLDFSQYTLESSLNNLGIETADVTDVILTHFHFDHCGGATKKVSDEGSNETRIFVPRFANARYYVQREHYEWALKPTEKDRASFMPENYMPLIERDVLDILEGPGELFPGIRVDLANGHTRALQMVTVSDSSVTVFYPADLMPTGAHISIPYGMGYDNFPLTTIAEKKLFLPRIIDERWIVIFEHDALRVGARITQGLKGPVLEELQATEDGHENERY